MKTLELKNLQMKRPAQKGLLQGRIFWAAVIVLVIVAAGAYAAYRTFEVRAAAAQATPTLQTAVARLGNLTITASGSGKTVAPNPISLSFPDSGTLSEVLVKAGDTVKAGQVLARLQTNNTDVSIAASLASAQLAVLNAQKALDDLNANSAMATAQALQARDQAQQALDNLQNPDLQKAQTEQALATAQQNLQTAQDAYNRTQMTASQNNIDAAYAQMLLAQKAYDDAQKGFANFESLPVDNIRRANAQAKLSSAKTAYDRAVANYNASTGTSSSTEKSIAAANLAEAEAALVQAQSNYDQSQKGPSAGDLAVAQATLAQAQSNYDRLKNGPDPEQLAIDQAALANAQAQLELAKEKKVVEELTAPIDGTVLSVTGNVGDSVGSSAVISLANLSQPMVEVNLDETDLDKAKVGNEADVTFDSMPDKTLIGKVVQVDPSLQSSGGVSTVVAEVSLDNQSLQGLPPLMIGMNASVDVIGGRAQNAVLVPIEALRRISADQYAVFVMENGQPRLHVVQVGLQDPTTAQILSGVKPGDVVTTGQVETKQ